MFKLCVCVAVLLAAAAAEPGFIARGAPYGYPAHPSAVYPAPLPAYHAGYPAPYSVPKVFPAAAYHAPLSTYGAVHPLPAYNGYPAYDAFNAFTGPIWKKK